MPDKAPWMQSTSRVTLTIEIPEDVFANRNADLVTVVVPFCHEGMRPDGLAWRINLAIKEVSEAARATLFEKGYITNG